MRISDWSSDVCSSDLVQSRSWGLARSASPISSLRHDRNQRFVGALLLLGIAVSMDWIINIAIGTLAVIGRHARAVHGPTVPVAFYQIGIGDECLTKSHHVRAVLLDGACRRRPIEADVIDHRSVETRPDR